jgi:hypothetical protein
VTTDVKGGPIRHQIGAGGTFVLRTVAGTVRIRGTDAAGAEVVAHDESGRMPELVVRRSAGSLQVEPERQGRTFFGAHIGIGVPDIDFEVTVPRGARVEIQSVSADVSGTSLVGEQSYKLVSGDLELVDGGGRIDAKSVSGDISVRGGDRLEVNATTTSGDLTVEADQLDALRLRTVSGDAVIAGRFASGPEHRVETVSGDLRVTPASGLTIEASGPVVGLRSSVAGRVTAERGQRGLVIGNGAARLRFRSMSGEVRVEGSDDSLAKATDLAEGDDAAGGQPDSLEILRAVERGEMDIEEASRLLAGEGDLDA